MIEKSGDQVNEGVHWLEIKAAFLYFKTDTSERCALLNLMGKWLSFSKNHLFFYGLFFFGTALFSGIKASLLATLLILLLNIGTRPLAGDLSRRLGFPAFLVIQSLISLGLFSFLWLAVVFVAGAAYPWVLCALLLLIAMVCLSFKKLHPPPSSKMPFEPFFVVLLILLTTYLPFAHVGKPQPEGLAYRAYFSSDYLKHFSVVEAINKGKLPPVNPYFEGENFHYYWVVYAAPAFLAKLGGSVPQALFSWSFAVNFLFLGALLLVIQKICVRCRISAYFLTAASLTVSLEGLYFFIQKCGFDFPKFLTLGSDYNIDALTRWLWNLPQIDTLLRSMLYTPQHLMGISLLLVFFLILFLDLNKPLLLSSILTMTLTASFFVGSILLLAWVVYFLVHEFRLLLSHKKSFFSIIKSGAAYFLLPLLALALFRVLQMTELGWRSRFFFQKLSLWQIAVLLFLNLGPLLLTGLAGGALVRFPLRVFHLTLFLLALLTTLFVRIRGFENDLSLKLGLVLIVQAVVFTAVLFEKFKLRSVIVALLLMLLILPGTMTLVLDVRNSADVTNRRYTFYLPEQERSVIDWIRQNVRADAVVQTFPPAREWNVSIIPPFAGRNMFVGDRMHGRIFQVDEVKYNQRLEVLARYLRDLPAARPELKRMGIDYVFWGKPELQYFGYYPALKKAFSLGDAVLYSLE
jgi:hypothetical protein